MKALITGICGQDGTYLSEHLLSKGYEVHGCTFSFAAEEYRQNLPLLAGVQVHEVDVTDAGAVSRLMLRHRFDEVYNLAAVSSVADSFHRPGQCFKINAMSLVHFLEIMRLEQPETRFYQASSSELFGGMPGHSPQNESTPFHPRSPYSVSKLAAHWLVINYREAYGLKCCAGILFNHESPRRKGEFLTRKVCEWAKLYRAGSHKGPLLLGNLDARRDWGHSRDFVKAMWMMLNADRLGTSFSRKTPVFREFVVGTGQSRSVREFVEMVFRAVGREIRWRNEGSVSFSTEGVGREVPREVGYDDRGEKVVAVAPEFWRPAEVQEIRADASAIRRELGWQPECDLAEIIREMLAAG